MPDPKNPPAHLHVRRVEPSLYGEFAAAGGCVTGMFYRSGKLYCTLAGDPNLYARWFSPDSEIVDEPVFTVKRAADVSDAGRMFASGSNLYYSTRPQGNLVRVKFSIGVVSGGPVVVSGPHVDKPQLAGEGHIPPQQMRSSG